MRLPVNRSASMQNYTLTSMTVKHIVAYAKYWNNNSSGNKPLKQIKKVSSIKIRKDFPRLIYGLHIEAGRVRVESSGYKRD
jgi:hypothetical protein